MLHNIAYVTSHILSDIDLLVQLNTGTYIMSIGNSGRLVIEIEPELKKELHAVLKKEGTNLKTWFLENVDHLLSEKGQQSLALEGVDQTAEIRK